MVEAGKSSSQTGELPSSGPFTDGTPIPDASLRPENLQDPLSSKPRRMTGLRKTFAGATTFAAIATGAGAINSPDSTYAGGNIKLYTAASGQTEADLRDIYCTPEYIAQYPQLLAGGDSNVGGELTTQSGDTAVAEVAGRDTAAILTPDTTERVIINFTAEDGTPLAISLPICPPTGEQTGHSGFPTAPDEARGMFMDGSIKIERNQLFLDGSMSKLVDLNILTDKKTEEMEAGMFVATILELKKIGEDYVVLFGGYNKKGKPFTYIQALGGNFNGTMAYETLPSNRIDYLSKLQYGRTPVSIDIVAKDLEKRKGEIFLVSNYIKPLNLGVPYFDDGLAKVADNNDALFDFVLAQRKGKKTPTHLLGINTPLSEITADQIKKLPSVWGIIHQQDQTPTN